MERPEYELTRADFHHYDDWCRYLHESGIGPEHDSRGRLKPRMELGHYGKLLNTIDGTDPGPARATRNGPSTSKGITQDGVQMLYRAMAFASWRSRFLNVHATVSWSTVAVVRDADVMRAHQILVDLMRRWLKGSSNDAHYVWVLERGEKLGLHSHILIHLQPGELNAFKKWLHRAVERIAGRPLLEKKDSKTIFVRQESTLNSRAQWEWGKYLLKGTDGTWQLQSVSRSDEGVIVGKRVGASHSLNDLAQRRAGFPRSAANIRTIEGDAFDGRFDNGEWVGKMATI